MSMIQKKRNNSRKIKGFRPDHDYIEQAVEDYLAGGGKITRLKADKRTFALSAAIKDDSADGFLAGDWAP